MVEKMTRHTRILYYVRLLGTLAGATVLVSAVFWFAVHAITGKNIISLEIIGLFCFFILILCGLLVWLIDRIVFNPMRMMAQTMHVVSKNQQSVFEKQKSPFFWWSTDEFTAAFKDNHQMVNILLNLSRVLSSTLDRNNIISTVLRSINLYEEGLLCCIIGMDTDGYLKVQSQRGFSAESMRLIRYRPGEGVIGKVYVSLRDIVINNTVQEGDGFTAILQERDKAESLLFLPLAIENQTLGVLSIASRTPAYFTPQRIKTMGIAAEYIAVALRNAQLYEQLQTFNRRLEAEVSSTTQELTFTNTRLIKKVRELKILYDILTATSTKLNINEVMALLMEKIPDLVDAELFHFLRYEKNMNALVQSRTIVGEKIISENRIHIDLGQKGILQDVFASKKMFFSNAVKQLDNVRLGIPVSYAVQSLICLPVEAYYEPIGVFCAGNKISGHFTQDDVRVLQLLINHLGEVIGNISLYHENEKRVGDLLVLQQISTTISSSPVLPVTLKNISHIIAESLSVDHSVFYLYDETIGELIAQVGFHGSQDSETRQMRVHIDDAASIPALVFKAGKPFTTGPFFENEEVLNLPETLSRTIKGSLIMFPLRVEHQIIGVLSLECSKENHFTSEHLRLVRLISDQAAIIVDNATLYQRIRDAVKELEKLNKMKNEFISIVSHELRTPITTIMGFLNIMLKEEAGPLTDQQRRFLRISEQSSNRLADLINDLLDVSHIESGRIDLHMVPSSISDLLQQTVDYFRAECDAKKVRLQLDCAVPLPMVAIDQSRILQVFKHLIRNSLKFTELHGKITVTAFDRGDYVQLDFADTGIGIAEEYHDKVFEKFFQVDASASRRAGGTGLGLSIVRSIVELHGGKVWVESKLGEGSVFKFIIPKSKLRESTYEKKGISS